MKIVDYIVTYSSLRIFKEDKIVQIPEVKYYAKIMGLVYEANDITKRIVIKNSRNKILLEMERI